MLKLACKIEIRNKDTNKMVSFDYVNAIEVKTSIRNLTDTAVVKVPHRMQWKERPLTDFIKRDDEISIVAGYEEYGLKTVFKGYLSGVENGYPVVINCENEMRHLKTINVPAQKIAKFDLKKFVESNAPGIRVDVPAGIIFGSMDIQTEMTMSQALDAVMQKYPYVKGYFQDGVLRIILNTVPAAGRIPIVFDPNRNMISDSLKYTRSDDVKICVKAVSILRDNSKLEAYAPATAIEKKAKKITVKSGYEQRQLFCPQCKTQKEVQEFADKSAKEWVTDKMSGTFKAFGIPFVSKGDIVEVRDNVRVEINGRRFVADSVDYNFDASGYRQTVTLGDEIKY